MRRLGGEDWALWLAERGIVALDEIDTRALTLRLRDGGAMRGVAVADERALAVADALEQVRAQPHDGGRGARRRGLDAGAVRRRRGGRRARRASSTTAPSARSCAGSRAAGAAVTVYPHVCDPDELAASRRRPALERPGRPGAARRGDARSSARCSAACRCSASASATSCSGSRRATRRTSCRSATAARTTRCSTGAPAACSSRARTTASRSCRPSGAEATHVSLYDGTVEGFDFPDLRAASVQFHPEAGPGPHDAWPILERWVEGLAPLMPARRDIRSICVIGSGPIVIGQACEFDYAGCQALKVLREDGYRTIVVNSNPATIMTDPGFADRTYIEPLDLEGVADVLRRERPDALLPTLGGQTALNLAIELDAAGVLDELGVELLGARVDVIRRAEDRELFRDAVQSCGLDGARRSRIVDVARRARRRAGAGGRPAGVHARRARRRLRGRPPTRSTAQVERGLAREPDRPGARRGVDPRLGRVRARGDPRPRRQRRDRLLDREPRPDGRPHRRLGHGGAADDALRRGVPGASRRRGRGDPRGRRRDGRLEHPVRAPPRDGRAARDRDEPARLALVGARLEGDRLPDREGRREARRRLHARRDPERPDEDDAGELRADARLRRRQVPALRVREVPGRRPDARHADEVGRRGDGDRADVHRGVPQGVRLARARSRARRRPGRRSTTSPTACIPWFDEQLEAAKRELRTGDIRRAKRAGWGDDSIGAAWGTSGDDVRRTRYARGIKPVVPARRLLRRRGRGGVELLLLDLGRGGRGAARVDEAARRDPRLGAEPDRAGDRVRLLLRPRRPDVPRARLRGGDGQLQPRDGLHRLRHLRPALLRAALAGGGARRPRPRAAGRRRDAVRRPDAAPPRAAHRGGRLPDPGHAARGDRPRRGPRAVRRARARARRPLPAVGDGRGRRRGARGRRGDRLPGARPPVVRARRPRDAGLRRRGRPARRDGGGERPGAGRPLRRERDRDRRRRALRRRGRLHRRGDAARRGGRRPLRRLVVRAPGAVAHARERARGRARRQAARARARRRRPAQRPARDRRLRRSTCSRRTRAPRAPCRSRARRPGSTSSRPPAASPHGETLADLELHAAAPDRGERQGGRAAVRALPGRRPGARAGDALDGRGDGDAPPTSRPRFAKAERAAGRPLPTSGTAFLSVRDGDKAERRADRGRARGARLRARRDDAGRRGRCAPPGSRWRRSGRSPTRSRATRRSST